MKRFTIIVFGKVQGVWFRASARQQALNLGLKGFARNEADGTVYIEAEGPEEKVRQLIEWCHEGPVGAIVTKVRVDEKPFFGFGTFSIENI